MEYKRRFVIVVLVFLLAGTRAFSAELTWSVTRYLIDSDQSLSFGDVQRASSAWQNGQKSSFGFSSAAVWLHLDLDNGQTDTTPFALRLGVSWLDEIDIYQVQDGQISKHWQLGDTRQLNPTLIRSFTPFLPITFPVGRSEIYIRVTSQETLMVPISIEPRAQAETSANNISFYFGAIYGSLILICVYNLFLYFSLRKKSFLYYSLFLFVFCLGSASYNGLLQYVWLHSGIQLSWSGFSTKLHPHLFYAYQFTGVLFFSRFVDTKHNHPKIHKLLVGFLALVLVQELMTVMLNTPAFSQFLSVASSSFYALLLVSLCVYLFNSKGLVTQLLTFGVSTSLIGTLIATATVYSIIPFQFLAFHAIEIGFVIDAALLSLALAAQLKQVENEKHRAQELLLQSESRKKSELETLVAQRTEKLDLVNKELQKLSVTDNLTQLHNRMGLNQQLQKQLKLFERYQHTFCLLMIDIDYFKTINDRFGHLVGDEVLVNIAKLIRQNIREVDVAGRWGGEEFVVLIPQTDLTGAITLAETLRKNIEQQSLHLDQPITISIGVTQVFKADDEASLVNRADDALYQAKKEGRNCTKVAANAH